MSLSHARVLHNTSLSYTHRHTHMRNPHPKEAVFSSQRDDKLFPQGGQFIDMHFMATSSTDSKGSGASTRRPWQRSLDSQEFGFAATLVDSAEVVPADELFFKGQLLPLQLDHRLHLVEALSSPITKQISKPTIARVGSTRLAVEHDLSSACPDDAQLIEFHSCRLEREVSLSMHTLLPLPLCVKNPITDIPTRDDKLDKPFASKIKGFAELDCVACKQDGRADDNGEGEDEELHFCNRNMSSLDRKIAGRSDTTTDPGSLSFRSQNSGFWDSGTDKDMMDSSSSRDSNGSSQDSYFHTNHTHSKAPPSHHHHHDAHSKLMSFNIPWKLAIFRRGPCRKQAPPHVSSIKVGFSEDLGKYKACAAPPLHEVKEALLPWKLERRANGQGSKKENQGKRLIASNDGRRATVMTLCKSSTTDICDAGVKKSSVQHGSKSFRGSTSRDEEMKTTQIRSAAAKERWQMYARRLKPLYEMKRGLMEQFRMDECGKKAYYEVEHGTICSTRQANDAAMQRRQLWQEPSSRIAAQKSHKLIVQQQKQANGPPNYKVMAMYSCPSSTISSPNHSGVLAVLDPNQKISTSKPANYCGKASTKSLSSTSVSDGASIIMKSSIQSSAGNAGGSNYKSISTMHELHSALQSAIAHCKESNQKLNHAAN